MENYFSLVEPSGCSLVSPAGKLCWWILAYNPPELAEGGRDEVMIHIQFEPLKAHMFH